MSFDEGTKNKRSNPRTEEKKDGPAIGGGDPLPSSNSTSNPPVTSTIRNLEDPVGYGNLDGTLGSDGQEPKK